MLCLVSLRSPWVVFPLQAALAGQSSSDSKGKPEIYAISHHFDYVGNLMRVRKSKEGVET